MNELQTNLSLNLEKNKYLENIIKITEDNKITPLTNSPKKKKKKFENSTPILSGNTDEKGMNNAEENGFTKKKRKKLTKVYQNILDRKFLNANGIEEKLNF